MPIIPAAAVAAPIAYNAPSPVVYLPPYQNISSVDVSVLTGSFTPTTHHYYFMPFELRRTVTFDSITVEVVTAFSGGNNAGRVAIYRSKTSGEPTPSTTAVDGGSTSWSTPGFKTYFVSAQLTAGLYWFAVQSDTKTAGTLRAMAFADGAPLRLGWQSQGSQWSSHLTQSGTSYGFIDVSARDWSTSLSQPPLPAMWARITSVP